MTVTVMGTKMATMLPTRIPTIRMITRSSIMTTMVMMHMAASTQLAPMVTMMRREFTLLIAEEKRMC